MKTIPSISVKLLLTILCFSLRRVSGEHEFFHFSQQWPISACNTKNGCCYSGPGKPEAKFIISHFSPVDHLGRLFDCPGGHRFDPSKTSNLTSTLTSIWPSLFCPSTSPSEVWSSEWNGRGTCSEPMFDQQTYFQAAIDLTNRIDLLTILNITGSTVLERPKTKTELEDIIGKAIGTRDVFIECNLDWQGKKQLSRVIMCVDKHGKMVMDCPISGRPLYYRDCDYNDRVHIPLLP